MITTILAAGVLSVGVNSSLDDYCLLPRIEQELDSFQRERIWHEMHFAFKKMHYELKCAHEEGWAILDIDLNLAICGAVEGAITGLAGKNVASVVLGSAVGAVAAIAKDGCFHAQLALHHLRESERFAICAEALQERLWNDE